MSIITWEEVFSRFMKKIDQVDQWKIIDYGKTIAVCIEGEHFKFPTQFKEQFKKQFATYEWVTEVWQTKEINGISFYRFSKICEMNAFQNYHLFSQRQKIHFKEILENDAENEYVILNNRVSFV